MSSKGVTKRLLTGLISQSKQIKGSTNYNMPTIGNTDKDRLENIKKNTLEEDLNVIRLLIKEIKGTNNWSDKINYDLSDIKEIKKTLLNSSGSSSSDKILITPKKFSGTLLRNERFLVSDISVPFANTLESSDIGYVLTDKEVLDENTKALITIRNGENNIPIVINGKRVVGIGRKVEDKLAIFFYIINEKGYLTPIALSSENDIKIEALMPYRDKLSNIDESTLMNIAWLTNSSDDSEYSVDIDYLETILGLNANEPTTNFSNAGANYLSNKDSIMSAIMKLDDVISNLDVGVNKTSPSIEKYVVILEEDIESFIPLSVPKFDNKNVNSLEVLVNGQLLVSDEFLKGGKGDYTELSSTSISFRFPLEKGDVMTYKIQ